MGDWMQRKRRKDSFLPSHERKIGGDTSADTRPGLQRGELMEGARRITNSRLTARGARDASHASWDEARNL